MVEILVMRKQNHFGQLLPKMMLAEYAGSQFWARL
jgi:hypothetical protein